MNFWESDIKRLYGEFEKILNEQNEKYLDCIKREEESVIERIFNNWECDTLSGSFKTP